MHGDFFGGVLALLYFLAFQACGMLLAACFFKTERRYVRAVLGSAVGSVLLMWLPALWAFALGFSVWAHLLALALLLLVTALALWRRRPALRVPRGLAAAFVKKEWGLLVPALLWFVFAGLLLHSFRVQDGEIWSSQCTYGDMSMHLGFITSIAEQGTFPPMYSILPGVKLSYPFLSDSISSSLYLLGAPLQLAYFLPMLFAAAQVFFGAWLFLGRFLRGRAKAALAMALFFLNGGFGVAYFLTDLGENGANFTRIFTAFYETPTNLVEKNIRWVNVIVDMMLPQRATLFGWAALFILPALFSARRHSFSVAAPAVVIWFICEFVVFQPNTYDNNKLLYAAYFLLCAVTASYLVELYRRLRGLPGRQVLAGAFLVFCTVSAILTIARESLAGYCLYGKGQLAVAAYVQENTEPDDTILTDMRHNNEIAALTGRNIVCGSTSYVYFHGLDYEQREADMRAMFQNPGDNLLLFKAYSVDYVMVSAYETDNFSANETALAAFFTCVYDENGVRLYKVPQL